jgi:hypothetical protein
MKKGNIFIVLSAVYFYNKVSVGNVEVGKQNGVSGLCFAAG